MKLGNRNTINPEMNETKLVSYKKNYPVIKVCRCECITNRRQRRQPVKGVTHVGAIVGGYCPA